LPEILTCSGAAIMAKEYFELNIIDLQNAVKWAIEYVERSLNIYESHFPDDDRPRKAIEGAKAFSENGKRTNALRKLAIEAYKASREKTGSASMAANAASLAAALAFTHPFRDKKQAEHILGPIAYSALSIEMEYNDKVKGDEVISSAIEKANSQIAKMLNEFPEHENSNDRLKELLNNLDNGIRAKIY